MKKLRKAVNHAAQLTIPFAISFIFTIGFAGCNTLLENSSSGYKPTKNLSGETVYRKVSPAPTWPVPSPPIASPQIEVPALMAFASDSSAHLAPDVPAPSNNDSPTRLSGHIEVARADDNYHLGLHMGYALSDWFRPRIGTSLFLSNDLYLGFDLSGRFTLPLQHVRPFLGLGAYLGDTKSCGTSFDSMTGQPVEVCDKKFLSAGYVELGVEFSTFSIFLRNYNLTRAGLSVPTHLFCGLGLRF